jgi:hypothetical protein
MPLQLAVFDLDYTVWQPEMYQLWGEPRLAEAPKNLSSEEKKCSKTTTDGMIVTDSSGSPITVFPGA